MSLVINCIYAFLTCLKTFSVHLKYNEYISLLWHTIYTVISTLNILNSSEVDQNISWVFFILDDDFPSSQILNRQPKVNYTSKAWHILKINLFLKMSDTHQFASF